MFGVHDDGVAELLTTTDITDIAVDPTIPQWVAETLYGLEVRDIDGIAGVE